MTKYINTPEGLVSVASHPTVNPGEVIVADPSAIFNADDSEVPIRRIFVHDEDEFIKILKEQYGEDSTGNGTEQGTLFPV